MVPLFIEALIYKKIISGDTSDKDDIMVTNLHRGGGGAWEQGTMSKPGSVEYSGRGCEFESEAGVIDVDYHHILANTRRSNNVILVLA